jgi:hypothetical protein
MRARFHGLLALLMLGLFAGCADVATRQVISLAPFKHIYVVYRLGDDHHLNELFAAEIRRQGHEASTGPLTMLPENADAVITYTDRWQWDFKEYLIEVTFDVHTARTAKKLADGRYYAPTPKSQKPEDILHELLAPLFKAK